MNTKNIFAVVFVLGALLAGHGAGSNCTGNSAVFSPGYAFALVEREEGLISYVDYNASLVLNNSSLIIRLNIPSGSRISVVNAAGIHVCIGMLYQFSCLESCQVVFESNGRWIAQTRLITREWLDGYDYRGVEEIYERQQQTARQGEGATPSLAGPEMPEVI